LDGVAPSLLLDRLRGRGVCRLPLIPVHERACETLAQERREVAIERGRLDLERCSDGFDRRDVVREGVQQRGESLEAPALLDVRANESSLHVRDVDLTRVARSNESRIQVFD